MSNNYPGLTPSSAPGIAKAVREIGQWTTRVLFDGIGRPRRGQSFEHQTQAEEHLQATFPGCRIVTPEEFDTEVRRRYGLPVKSLPPYERFSIQFTHAQLKQLRALAGNGGISEFVRKCVDKGLEAHL